MGVLTLLNMLAMLNAIKKYLDLEVSQTPILTEVHAIVNCEILLRLHIADFRDSILDANDNEKEYDDNDENSMPADNM